jgi:hypothetical protein
MFIEYDFVIKKPIGFENKKGILNSSEITSVYIAGPYIEICLSSGGSVDLYTSDDQEKINLVYLALKKALLFGISTEMEDIGYIGHLSRRITH